MERTLELGQLELKMARHEFVATLEARRSQLPTSPDVLKRQALVRTAPPIRTREPLLPFASL